MHKNTEHYRWNNASWRMTLFWHLRNYLKSGNYFDSFLRLKYFKKNAKLVEFFEADLYFCWPHQRILNHSFYFSSAVFKSWCADWYVSTEEIYVLFLHLRDKKGNRSFKKLAHSCFILSWIVRLIQDAFVLFQGLLKMPSSVPSMLQLHPYLLLERGMDKCMSVYFRILLI